MPLFEVRRIIPHPIEDVFALMIDLENAPRWHIFFTRIQQLTINPIGIGSRWKMTFGVGSFVLEIIDFQPPHRVAYRGTPIMGIVPNFTIELQSIAEGTLLHYTLHPDTPTLWKPFMAIFAPPYGRWDLNRYFLQLDTALAAQS